MTTPQAVQERWDVDLKVLDGPLSAQGEQVYRGPVVRIGANPGPGGLALTGYRGLDARQCVITAYDGGTAAVASVGTNQVRMAPHANVDWREIDPIRGPTYLSRGCAVHLGPVGRGATVEFVECRRLGVWQQGNLASEVADLPAVMQGRGSQLGRGPASGAPTAYDVRRVGRISATWAPAWFLGCLFSSMSLTAVVILLIGGAWLFNRKVAPLGPVEDGLEFYKSVDLAQTDFSSKRFTDLKDGLQQPIYDFVMGPNSEISARADLQAPENWDERLDEYITASVEQHVRAWQFFSRLDAVRNEYAKVVLALRGAGLPEVFAAIPYQESRYRASFPSQVCADGYWQFMPEVAYRIGTRTSLDFRVRDCRLKGRTGFLWSPTTIAPPRDVRNRAEYVDQGECQITSCAIDDRQDLEKSTAAAMYTLGEAWNDETLRASGAAVQLTILSHNAGYDDGRFGAGLGKRSNILPAYRDWVARAGGANSHRFYGENIKCPRWDDTTWCGASLPAETQHYAYAIIAQHLLAVCYFAHNYGEEPAFRDWIHYDQEYCSQFKIPAATEVQARRKGGGGE